jgi:Putative Ig domain
VLGFRVTDSQGRVATSPALTLSVTDPLIVSTTTLSAGVVRSAYSATVSAVGGTGTYTFSASGLPSGLTISTTGLISGTPTVTGTRTVTLRVLDSAGRSAVRSMSMTVTP